MEEQFHTFAQIAPEEHPACDGYEAEQSARAEYEADLDFALLQLRARSLVADGWTNYQRALDRENVVQNLLKRHELRLEAGALSILRAEALELHEQRYRAFMLWFHAQRLGFCDGRGSLAPDEIAEAVQSVNALEQEKADALLRAQEARRQVTSERHAAELAGAAN